MKSMIARLIAVLMKMIVLVLLACLMYEQNVIARDPSPVERFRKAKRLIEHNTEDSTEATAEGINEGIEEMERAINAGYKNKVQAYKLLAHAYSALRGYYAHDSERLELYRTKVQELYRLLYRLAPSDPEVLWRYSSTLKDDRERLPILRKALALNPQNIDLRFVLGNVLINLGQPHEGLQELYKAFALETEGRQLGTYASLIVDTLDHLGCPIAKEAVTWMGKLGELDLEAERLAKADETSSKLGSLKQKLLEGFKRHRCN